MPTKPPVAIVSPSRMSRTASAAVTILPVSGARSDGAVDGAVLEGVELREDVRVAGDDAREIHDLGETVDDVVIQKSSQVGGVEGRARGCHVRRGDAAGSIGDDAKRQAPACVGHEADARRTGDVGDLVRVGDGGGHAARDDRGGDLAREAERAFDVDVAVDQARRDEGVLEVDGFAPGVAGADAGDAVGVDGDVGGFDRAGKDVDVACVLEKEVGGAITARDGEGVRGEHQRVM